MSMYAGKKTWLVWLLSTKSFSYYSELDECHYTIIVKEEFFEKCPNPHLYSHRDLIDKFRLRSFLHCLTGPAGTNHTLKTISYWIDGIWCPTFAEWELLAKQKLFDNKIEILVNE